MYDLNDVYTDIDILGGPCVMITLNSSGVSLSCLIRELTKIRANCSGTFIVWLRKVSVQGGPKLL